MRLPDDPTPAPEDGSTPHSPALYLETVHGRLAEWTQAAGERVVSLETYQLQHTAGKIPMRGHVLVVEAAPKSGSAVERATGRARSESSAHHTSGIA